MRTVHESSNCAVRRGYWRKAQRRRSFLFAILATLVAGAGQGQQLLGNADFDADLSQWTLPVGLGSAVWSGDDADASATSGSAIVITNRGQGTGDAISQCHLIDADTSFEASAHYRIPSGQSEPGSFLLVMQFFSAAGCNDPDFISAQLGGSPVGAPTDVWDTVVFSGVTPPGAMAVNARFNAHKGSGGIVGQPFEVHVDRARLTLQPGLIFQDGFESGGVGEWSASSP